MYCLKPWFTEISFQQDISKDVCTCLKPETEVEEIAAGISRALIQTQQLREKLTLNVTEKNSKSFSMYECSTETVNKKQKKVKNLNANDKNIRSKQELHVGKPSTQKISTDKGFKNKVAQTDIHKICKNTKNDDKQLITQPVKLTGSKNFLAINKRNIKNLREVKQHKDINHKLENNAKSSSSITESKCIKFGERHSVASTSELKNLIHKVSTKSNNYTFSNEHNVKCPLHGNVTSQCTSKQDLITTTVVESFNMTNIPEEIIKPLKVYHAYLNVELSEKLFNEKRQKAFHKFLVELNKMDNIAQKKLSHKDYIITPLLKFMPLFQTLFFENLKTSNLINVKKMYAELSSAWKMYEVEEFNSSKILKNNVWERADVISTTTECMSNGIWNFYSTKNFEGMSKICCIRYINKNQLLLFFDVMQQLQHIKYYEDLIKIIAKDVLPNMKIFFDSTQLEYIKMYKMISILYQGLNPKIPVLVRTDK